MWDVRYGLDGSLYGSASGEGRGWPLHPKRKRRPVAAAFSLIAEESDFYGKMKISPVYAPAAVAAAFALNGIRDFFFGVQISFDR